MTDIQQRMRNALDELVDSGTETGLQVAAYRHGELVVDAVAGVADVTTGAPVDSGTLFFSTSTGKALTSTLVHLLVDRGVLTYDTPVVDLWPAFGAHGKAGTTIRHVLTHTAGVPGVPADTTPADLADWAKMCRAIEDAEPWWEPGTRVGYHAMTFGYLAGEIVRLATGRPLAQVLRDEIAAPLGFADELFFGVPAEHLASLARLEENVEPLDDETLAQLKAMMPNMFRAAPLELMPSAELYNRDDFRAADVPAGATVSARAIARLYAALLGQVPGVRLISPDLLPALSAVAFDGVDEVFGNPGEITLGFGKGQPLPEVDRPRAFGWSGVNGSHAHADPDAGLTFALTKNQFTSADFTTVTQVLKIVDDWAYGES